MRIFLDSNVLIDYWLKRTGPGICDQWCAYAKQALESPCSKITSSYSIAHLKNEITKLGLGEKNFLLASEVLAGEFQLGIIQVSRKHAQMARELMQKIGVREAHFFEDFVGIAVALEQGADIFVTRDLELIEKAGHLIQMTTPADFSASQNI